MAVSARVRRAGGVLLLAASGVLAACTSNPTPAPLPSLSPSQSGGSSATDPTPPVLPAAAHGTGPKAAKAFVRYWVATLNYAGATGDTSQLRSISSPKCASCSAVLRAIHSVYASGGSARGHGWRIRQVTYQPFQPGTKPVLSVAIHVAPQVIVASKGAKPRNYKGGRNLLNVTLLRSNGGWQMAKFTRLS